MRILIIEDDAKIASFIEKGLKQAGYVVDIASDGDSGLDLLVNETYDAAVVDIMLPGLDGLTLVERFRRQEGQTYIIFLSARRGVEDRVKGLQMGGDDYLVKPFAFSELLARLQAHARRASGTVLPTRLGIGDLEMDLRKRTVVRGDRAILLNNKEFSLLEYLMRNVGRVVSKTMIMEHVWQYDFDPQTNVVEASICRLRNKLNEGFETKLIRTLRGVGYVLE